MEKTVSLLAMLSTIKVVRNSHIPIKELECSGKQTLEKMRSLIELEFLTEKIAVEEDYLEPLFLLVAKSAERSNQEQRTGNGTL